MALRVAEYSTTRTRELRAAGCIARNRAVGDSGNALVAGYAASILGAVIHDYAVDDVGVTVLQVESATVVFTCVVGYQAIVDGGAQADRVDSTTLVGS